jgi:hypothetical protein
MNERSAEIFAALAANQVALRGLTKISRICGKPDEHVIRVVTAIAQNGIYDRNGLTRLYQITCEIADYDAYYHRLSTTLTMTLTNGSLVEQVREYWRAWEAESWVSEDSIVMYRQEGFGGKLNPMNYSSYFMDILLANIYGQIISRSQTTNLDEFEGVPKAQYFTTAAIRLGGFLKRRRQDWESLFSKLQPLGQKY